MSETPKFTPGPWYPPHLSDDSTTCNCRSIVEGGYAGGIATVHVHNGIASIRDGGNEAPPLEEAKANGHLIAAAPELYDALKAALPHLHELDSAHQRIVEAHGNCYSGLVVVSLVEAALAKAEGRK